MAIKLDRLKTIYMLFQTDDWHNSSTPMIDSNSGDGSLDKLLSAQKVFRNPSQHRPPPGSSHLETFATMNKIGLDKCKLWNPHSNNTSKDERRALKSLTKDSHITIKSADKGAGVVLWDTGLHH